MLAYAVTGRLELSRRGLPGVDERIADAHLQRLERLVGEAVADEDVVRICEVERNELVCSTHSCEVAASDDSSCLIDNTDSSVDRIAHLMN